MDRTIPPPAALLLDFIGQVEAKGLYNVVYGFNQRKLDKPITEMTVDEVISNQLGFTRAFGSSATGRYQFMRYTLIGLKQELQLRGTQIFDPDLQDRLGYHLLLRRGYGKWIREEISNTRFGLGLAQEWASFPVLAQTGRPGKRAVQRGETYYAGDGINKVLTTPEMVEGKLKEAFALRNLPTREDPIPEQPVPKLPLPGLVEQFWAWVLNGFRRV